MKKMIDGPLTALRGKVYQVPIQHPIPLYPTVGTSKSPVREPTGPRGQRVWKVLLKCDTAGKRPLEEKGKTYKKKRKKKAKKDMKK